MPLDGKDFHPEIPVPVVHPIKFNIPLDEVEALKKVRMLIAAGWCQSTAKMEYKDGRKEYCFLGAMREAGIVNRPGLLGFGSYEAMYKWNDRPSRTHASVLRRVDRAISAAEWRAR